MEIFLVLDHFGSTELVGHCGKGTSQFLAMEMSSCHGGDALSATNPRVLMKISSYSYG